MVQRILAIPTTVSGGGDSENTSIFKAVAGQAENPPEVIYSNQVSGNELEIAPSSASYKPVD